MKNVPVHVYKYIVFSLNRCLSVTLAYNARICLLCTNSSLNSATMYIHVYAAKTKITYRCICNTPTIITYTNTCIYDPSYIV